MAADDRAVQEVDRLPPMDRYVFGLLRRPSNPPSMREEELNQLQEGHLAHLRRLMETGELITVGPLEEAGDLRGVLVFRTASVDRARELMREDPAVAGGRLSLEVYPWFAPAGLSVGGSRPPRGPSTA